MSPAVLIATVFSAVPLLAASCESLTWLSLPDTTITAAQSVVSNKDLPPYCRVAATLKPSSDSDIKIEVWMPASGWNGKFEAVGNGGWSGSISNSALASAVQRGFAGASTDT